MKRRPHRKSFKGLVPYGKARHALFSGWAANVSKMESRGHMSLLEAMTQRSGMQRSFLRKSAA